MKYSNLKASLSCCKLFLYCTFCIQFPATLFESSVQQIRYRSAFLWASCLGHLFTNFFLYFLSVILLTCPAVPFKEQNGVYSVSHSHSIFLCMTYNLFMFNCKGLSFVCEDRYEYWYLYWVAIGDVTSIFIRMHLFLLLTFLISFSTIFVICVFHKLIFKQIYPEASSNISSIVCASCMLSTIIMISQQNKDDFFLKLCVLVILI